MIICFSGTGNSLYAARQISGVTGDQVVSVNPLMKSGSRGDFTSEMPYVFVCPTYAWRIPRIFESFIREAHLAGSRKAYFVLTCGSEPGNAAYYAQKLCDDIGLEFMGLATIIMPENYIALYDAPERAEAEEIIQKAEPAIKTAVQRILGGQTFPQEKVSNVGRLLSTVVNPVFYKVIVKAKGFRTTDACTGCGKCLRLCPLNNLRLEKERPRWGAKCTHCMACICGCPTGAIEYKKSSVGKPRYTCPTL